MEQFRRAWIDSERKKNPSFAPDIESWKELLNPEQLVEVREYETLKYKTVARQGPEAKYKPYKLSKLDKKRLVELDNKYRSHYVDRPHKEYPPVSISELADTTSGS